MKETRGDETITLVGEHEMVFYATAFERMDAALDKIIDEKDLLKEENKRVIAESALVKEENKSVKATNDKFKKALIEADAYNNELVNDFNEKIDDVERCLSEIERQELKIKSMTNRINRQIKVAKSDNCLVKTGLVFGVSMALSFIGALIYIMVSHIK